MLLKAPRSGNTAAIVNEFGEIGLDHALVISSIDNVVFVKAKYLCTIPKAGVGRRAIVAARGRPARRPVAALQGPGPDRRDGRDRLPALLQRVFRKLERLAAWQGANWRSRLRCLTRDGEESAVRRTVPALRLPSGSDPNVTLADLAA
jgi:hypothetical protein